MEFLFFSCKRLCTVAFGIRNNEIFGSNPTFVKMSTCNSLAVARQNVRIASVLTDFTRGSSKEFDVALSLIGSKEMM